MILIFFSIETNKIPCSYSAPFVSPNILYTHQI